MPHLVESVLAACHGAQQWQEALRVFERISKPPARSPGESGAASPAHKPTERSVLIALDACARLRDGTAAERIFVSLFPAAAAAPPGHDKAALPAEELPPAEMTNTLLAALNAAEKFSRTLQYFDAFANSRDRRMLELAVEAADKSGSDRSAALFAELKAMPS